MARMLQALKNLEARTGGVARALGPIAHLAETKPGPPQQPEVAATRLLEPVLTDSPTDAVPSASMEAVHSPDGSAFALSPPSVVLETAAAPSASAFDPILVTEVADFRVPLPAPEERGPPIATAAIRTSRRFPVVGQTASNLERGVARALSDPLHGQPLHELADRLSRDLAQTGSKTVLLVGLGPHSSVQRPLLCSAALLAERTERVLVIDADLARRDLTEGLQAGQEPGFAELLRSSETSIHRCRPTAFADVSFLPAGLLHQTDLSTAGPRLENVLRQLTGDFSLLLLDGGCGRDLGAVTLARLCDVTYFVVQLGTVEASQAQSALRDFRAAGARVLGCIAT